VLEPLSGYLLAGMLLDKDAAIFSGAYNFGPLPDDHLPVKNLVETAIGCWGEGKWIDASDGSQPHEAGLLQLDISKAKNILNWQPRLNSATSITWTINWYKQPPVNAFNFTLQQIKNYQQ
jgi:CDP-glucose 4,6-dehydratase